MIMEHNIDLLNGFPQYISILEKNHGEQWLCLGLAMKPYLGLQHAGGADWKCGARQ